ncbi:MAG: hypothetical protein ACFFD2_13940, partial [Promethearchaeota archaeon]
PPSGRRECSGLSWQTIGLSNFAVTVSRNVNHLTEKALMEIKDLFLDLCKFTLVFDPQFINRDVIESIIERFSDWDKNIREKSHNIFNLAARKAAHTIDKEIVRKVHKNLTYDLFNVYSSTLLILEYRNLNYYIRNFKIRL